MAVKQASSKKYVHGSFEAVFRRPDYDDALKAAQRVKDVHARDREGNTLLCMAAYYGHWDACRWLIERGCDLEQAAHGRTPLVTALWALGGMGAIHDRFFKTLMMLLSSGADVTCCDDDGWTPLHLALRSTRRFSRLASELLDRGAKPNARTNNGLTPLMVAAGHGDARAVRLLLARGAEVDARDDLGRTALYCSVSDPTTDDERAGGATVAAALLKSGATLSTIDSSRDRTLLMEAALAGYERLTRGCIAAGQDVNARDRDGMSSLLFACAGGQLSVVDLLLSAGADPHATDSRRRGAMSLAHDERIRQRLTDATLAPPLLNDVDSKGVTRLMRACDSSDVDSVRRYLAEGDPVNAQDKQGKTALIRVLEPSYHTRETVAVVQLLCEQPSLDVRLATKTGLTALHCAVRVSGPHENIVVRLLERGADPRAKTKTGKTAIAVVKSYDDELRRLLKDWSRSPKK